jgi:hypothetical protein
MIPDAGEQRCECLLLFGGEAGEHLLCLSDVKGKAPFKECGAGGGELDPDDTAVRGDAIAFYEAGGFHAFDGAAGTRGVSEELGCDGVDAGAFCCAKEDAELFAGDAPFAEVGVHSAAEVTSGQ